MKYEKIINIFVEEEPETANAGDLMFLKSEDQALMMPKKSQTHWNVYRYCGRGAGGFWAELSRFSHWHYIKETYGVDLEGK